MKVIYGVRRIGKFKSPVVALGVFDGVHRGHLRILKDTVRKARDIKGTSMVLTFWPHPQKEESLYSLEHRLRLIEGLGIDVCAVINFNKDFLKISAFDFVKKILVDRVGTSNIRVGRNFRFGKNAEGDIETLKRLSKQFNYKLKVFKMSRINDKPISSTCIRSLIKKGNLAMAQKLLMRPVSIMGTVIKGVSLARKLGYPTANINPHHEVIPPSGVYAVKIIFNDKKLKGICNIGIKPTFNRVPNPDIHIELHIFNFKENIYGKYLEIQFLGKIRNERKFKNPAALIKQIKKDIEIAQKRFSRH